MIWVWRVADGQLAAELQSPESTGRVRFSPDGKLLASLESKAIRIWEVGTWKEIRTLRFDGLGGNALAFSPSGKVLASSVCLKLDIPRCTQAAVILWDPYKGLEIGRIVQAHKSHITDLAFLSEEILVTGSLLDDSIQFWQLSTGRLVRSIYPVAGVAMFEISPNKKLLAVIVYVSRALEIWDVASVRELGSPRGNFVGLSFSPSGQFFAGSEGYSQQEDRKLVLEIWRVKEAVRDWQVARTLHIPLPNPINHFLGSLSFSPDGKILAIHIWNAAGVEESIQLWYVGDLR